MARLQVELRGRMTFISVTEDDDPLDGAQVAMTNIKMEIGLTNPEVHALVNALAQIQIAIATMDQEQARKAGHLRLVDGYGKPIAPKES